MDETNTASRPELPSYIVGIGASAGGLEALEAFFTRMAPDSGMAFVVIQHLSPDYKSLMVELLSKRTQMPVRRAEEGTPVLANTVYLIPPKRNLTIFHGRLLLTPTDHSRGINLPIDLFLRSLADDQAEKAIAVILSGAGSDGVRGLRAVKEAGGMVVVQTEESARFDGMPRSAVATGLADLVVPVEEIPEKLLSFARHPYAAPAAGSPAILSDEDGLTRIFSLLRDRTRVDFTYYKPSTLVRRIERRMSVNQVTDLNGYVRLLDERPGEVTTLYRELLIGVTSFFRDREVFDELGDKYLPELVASADNREMRFWVSGCSTGEEAYSLAILARECMERLEKRVNLKIFATDIDRDALTRASAGLFAESIAADLSPRLLAKYFQRNEDHYRVDRTVREMVVFAHHNLVKDPPFTNIDLFSCRNLLIYLQPVLQHKVLDLANFSLRPEGLLLLGTSETTGDASDLFEPLNHKLKIYRSRGKRRVPLEALDLTVGDSGARPVRASLGATRGYLRARDEERVVDRLLQALAGDYVPLAVVVNEQLEVLHILGDPGGYIRLQSGAPLNDVLKMAAKGLTTPLATGLQRSFKSSQEVRYTNVRVEVGAASQLVNLRICPLPGKKNQDLLSAVFIEPVMETMTAKEVADSQVYDASQQAEQRIRDLEQELQFTRENLQATIEELETSNEELQATNEELVAGNEELQSTNEELQSVNEELHTVNAEYQQKILELTQANNDVDNILASSRVGTMLIDENMDLRRYTPEVTRIFDVGVADIGRSFRQLRHSLVDVEFEPMLRAAEQGIEAPDVQVKAQDGSWYLLRVFPYRVGATSVSGAVILLSDITNRKQTEQALSLSESRLDQSEQRFRRLFETMTDGVVYQDAEGHVVSANPAAERILGLTEAQMQGRTSADPRWRATRTDGSPLGADDHPAMVALRTGQPVRGFIMGVYSPAFDGTRWLRVNAVPLSAPGGERPEQVYTTFEDITDATTITHRLAASEQRLHAALGVAGFAWWEWNVATGRLDSSPFLAMFVGLAVDDVSPSIDFWRSRLHPEDRAVVEERMRDHLEGRAERYDVEYRLRHASGKWIPIRDRGRIVERDADGRPALLIGTIHLVAGGADEGPTAPASVGGV